ncbi:MAG: hypothetical protein MK000_01295 [Anaerolineales bacterium]|nr:hypothetical protein [Anaerolineales bacterium]
MNSTEPRGMYFEQFEVGMQIVTSSRTVTEADIVNFAGLSGDFNQIHTDAIYASTTPFGQRVAHGLLGVAIASGLAVQTGFMEGTILAFREIAQWKFSHPILIEDTIHVLLQVKDTKTMPRLKGGAVTMNLTVRNQKDETVQHGQWVVLIQNRP